ncbi:hypothetical protein ABVK25_005072 [Lepraria finkii]|uniref:Protein BNI4 n=1 Tax=Lepraria finkii TaxID=1340010 RepID=A0ABR4BBH1_9LECA
MLQPRPSSSEAFQSGSPGQQHQRNNQIPRTIYNTSVNGMGAGAYRGHTSTSPVSPYTFTTTPILQNGQNPLRQHPTGPQPPRLENRTASAPSLPFALQASLQNSATSSRPRPPAIASSSTPLSNSNIYAPQLPTSKDDSTSTLSSKQSNTRLDLNPPPLPPASYAAVAKSSPDRYRRNHRRAETSGALGTSSSAQSGSAMPSGSGMATVGHLYTHPTQTASTPTLISYPSYRGAQSTLPNEYNSGVQQPMLTSKDDINLQRERQAQTDPAKRYRRRSISSLEAKGYAPLSETPALAQQAAQPKTYAAMLAGPAPQPQERREIRSTPTMERPTSSHGRNSSNESSCSIPSTMQPAARQSSSSKRFEFSSSKAQEATPIAKNEAKVVNIPARGSSEANKRLTTPSPLSKPMTLSPEMIPTREASAAPEQPKLAAPTMAQPTSSHSGIPESPAAQHLAALNKKEGKKDGKSSRLRRAFSFGSAAELRKVSAENSANNAPNERAKLRKDRYHDEQEAQQAAEIQKQEEAGLGAGIYSGQGHFFTGSTDNLSISSTASSASVMIRKMGKGMKKGSRSLVGLFRPKSVVGVPAADSAVPEPSMAQVSMVTVEAEREKVNVNVNPHDQAGGGTGFPKLERNSLDAARAVPEPLPFSDRDSSRGRRSIVGGEEERAKVLAAVKKGILKRNGTDSGNSSPVMRPVDSKAPDFNLPQILHFNESPHSSAPSTPADERGPRTGHRRTDSVNIEGEDYFLSTLHFANGGGESKSVPGTPRSSAARGVTFDPRKQFYDTWPPGEYDRRGEIATCNRLTPMLAQQIKEELNTFKMEMEVHTESKVYTHFF